MYKISLDGSFLSGRFSTLESALAWVDIIRARSNDSEIKLFYDKTLIEVF